ncbi:MAG: DUF1801 domain-containing protein [Methanobacteriaceae archaeon]|nr:DUF1801 domain-containing protein [Methanobacteriaceae archaeon]
MKKKEDSKETENNGAEPETVDDYIAAAPEKAQPILDKLRKTIKAAAPEAEEAISYRIPTYKYHGPLVHFAAFKNHNSFIVVNKSILELFKSELEDYHTSGTTIHFSAENPLPEELVKKIVYERIKQNEKQ